MTRRELFAIIHFVTVKFSFYLLGQNFMLRTDHSLLRWLESFHNKATDVLARWLHYLEPFRPQMTILYRPGKNLGNADALSRLDTRPCPREDCPDHGHLVRKEKQPSEKKYMALAPIVTRSHDTTASTPETLSDVVPSFSNEEIKDSQQ